MQELIWLLLPVAAVSGWLVARREYRKCLEAEARSFNPEYFKGLNFLINEQPDKAIDVFVRMLEVDKDTVDIHLALGSLFRRRGEVSRAIRVHQNLIVRSNLSAVQRGQVLFELAQDYMSAGLLDRAEELCQEIIDSESRHLPALKLLRDIYEQEKEWFRAVDVVRKIETCTGKAEDQLIAQYYCEIADNAQKKGDIAQAERMLERAIAQDDGCARAMIMQGDLRRDAGDWSGAIQHYQRLEKRAPQYLAEVLASLVKCHEACGQRAELLGFLKKVIHHHSNVELLLAASRMIFDLEGESAAANFLGQEISKRPSLHGVNYMLELEMQRQPPVSENYALIKTTLNKLLAAKPVYRCANCGFTGNAMHWSCPSCKRWSSIRSVQERGVIN
ncbi:MAG: lipopolysaccharide assembly protein LapB [Gammaproteobacteria bacterium]|nr:lipopolysaccharide assembly protein LapB [Gammaproteobacteria bacterium]